MSTTDTPTTEADGPADESALTDIATALEAFARGEILVVVDDEDRENEGDLIMAAEFVTPEKIAFFLHHTSGFICAPITSERAAELDLRPMVEHNTESMRTAFLVSIDYRHDTTTGISAGVVSLMSGVLPEGTRRTWR